MKTIYCLLLTFCFTSCITINENGYTVLRKSDLAKVKPFAADLEQPVKYDAGLAMEELTAAELKTFFFAQYPYALVYLCAPWCKGEYCKSTSCYAGLDQQFGERGLKLMVVSRNYDLKKIEQEMKGSGYDRAIYVVKDSAYGHGMTKGLKLFQQELFNTQKLTEQQRYASHYLFNGDKLICAGLDLSPEKPDSLLPRQPLLSLLKVGQ